MNKFLQLQVVVSYVEPATELHRFAVAFPFQFPCDPYPNSRRKTPNR